jgi:sulfonate transport system substrate-binding protein
MLALALIGLSGALSVYAATRPPERHVLAAGALPLDAPLPTRVPAGVKLVIGDPITEVILKRTGWDRELPFKVQWAKITGGPGVTEAFHAKVLDVGFGADMPPIHAAWIGMPVKIIAVRLRKDPLAHPTYVLAVAPNARVNSLADLRGKRIAYSPGQAQGELVIRTLISQGLTPKDVTLVELPSTSADAYVNALVGGAIDVAPLGAGAAEKHYIERFASSGAKVLAHGPARDDFLCLFVRQETLEDPAKAAALRAYIRLWGRAQAWMNAHPDEWARAYFVDDQRLTPDDARYAAQAYGQADVPARWDDAIALQQTTVDLMARVGGRPRFDAARLFDRRFEAEAAAEAIAGTGAPKLAAR